MKGRADGRLEGTFRGGQRGLRMPMEGLQDGRGRVKSGRVDKVTEECYESRGVR